MMKRSLCHVFTFHQLIKVLLLLQLQFPVGDSPDEAQEDRELSTKARIEEQFHIHRLLLEDIRVQIAQLMQLQEYCSNWVSLSWLKWW